MELKGFVIDTKPCKSAMLILTPRGKAVIAKSDDKTFKFWLDRAAIGDWICVVGDALENGLALTFTGHAKTNIAEFQRPNGEAKVCCDNDCGSSIATGYCREFTNRQWTQLTDAFEQARGAIIAQRATKGAA